MALVKKSKQVERQKGKRKKGKKAKGHKGKRAKSRRYVLAAGGQPPTEGHCLKDLSASRMYNLDWTDQLKLTNKLSLVKTQGRPPLYLGCADNGWHMGDLRQGLWTRE